MFKEIINNKYSDKHRTDLMYYNLIHARFNLLRKYVSWNKHNRPDYKKNILKLIIDLIIETCDWALVYKNIFKNKKIDIIKEFKKNFKLHTFQHVPWRAYEIRSSWYSYTFKEKELDLFVYESIFFMQELVTIIYNEHSKN